ncbi:MAG: DUF429 domain-containing protein [bacterium]|jgi:predicted nuclease with RNAse H fold|nr:DUF429 domain-containing protein [bacterium]
MRCYGGIDPSSSEEKPSGCAILGADGLVVKVGHAYRDEEIQAFFTGFPLTALGIDAPSSLPAGMSRCCLEHPASCRCPHTPARTCERQMRQRGFPLYPVTKTTFPAAKAWIKRGLGLYARWQVEGVPCFEIYPYATRSILFPDVAFPKPKRSRACRALLQQHLWTWLPSLAGQPYSKTCLSDHELDSLMGALTVCLFFEQNRGVWIGDLGEGRILIPA